MSQRDRSVTEKAVLDAVRDAVADDRPAVVATVVDVEGSAYRRPGAKMLVEPTGSGHGHITAGCLEDEVFDLASDVLDAGEPRIETYDLTADDDNDVWGMGVGCNGLIEVLLEPLTETYRPAVEAFFGGRDVAVVTVIDGDRTVFEQGDRAYYHPDTGRLTAPDGSETTEWPAASLSGPAAELAGRGAADTVTVGDGVEVFVDGLAAPQELVVFGTGHDVGPVTEFAAKNDFRVTVVGFRGAVDLAGKFPAADRVVTTSPPTIAEDLDLDGRTHAVVMTHNFVDDRLTVQSLLEADVPYIGLMGPRERFEEMLEAFEEAGDPLDGDLSTLYTPVGLDLGGGSPFQIAHSIVAEVLAVSNGRTPRHLKTREGPIHERVDVESDADAPVQ